MKTYVKNLTQNELTLNGQILPIDTYIEIFNLEDWGNSDEIINLISTDAIIIAKADDGSKDIESYIDQILHLKGNKATVEVLANPAFATSVLPDGKILYLKIHGMRDMVPAAEMVGDVLVPGEKVFKFTNIYPEVYLQGAEIFVDILAQTDMTIDHPIAGVLEQYGFNVCMGKVIYKREAKYAAKLPQGIEITCLCKNTELTEQEMGVNFILHEIRENV